MTEPTARSPIPAACCTTPAATRFTRRAVGLDAAFFTRLTAAAADFLADAASDTGLRARFLADDALRLRAADFFRGAALRAEDFLAELLRPPDFFERERLLPLFFRALDFLDVAMKMLRK